MQFSDPLNALFALAIGYVLGSIPFGLIFTKAAGLGDIRAIGSGNIGATNVLRTGRKGLAAATLFADAGKGFAAVIAADWLMPGSGGIAGLGAFLGHLFPATLGFKGGKGVATYLGVAAAVHWPAALLFAGVWLTVAALSRYSSLAALTGALAVPFYLDLALAQKDPAILFALMSLLVYWRHAANIKRLLRGEESKLGRKSP
jgi:glycerol-3-phosphate acyltransferase PlsY